MSAQTMQAAAGLVEEKHSEIVRFFPLIGAEIVGKPQFSKDNAEIHFTSGSTISTLANAQSSKGKRRHSNKLSCVCRVIGIGHNFNCRKSLKPCTTIVPKGDYEGTKVETTQGCLYG